MTFSIIAIDKPTGQLGLATATRSLAVGVRVPHVKPRVGAIAIMAVADPRLGELGLRLLETGFKAPRVVEEIAGSELYGEYRQLGVIDADGNAAARTGRMNRDWAGHRLGDGLIVLGNVLVGPHVLEAMEGAFLAHPALAFEERLMKALEAGRDAGGQHGGQSSAAIRVVGHHSFPLVDLRVDIHDEPVGELRRVFDAFRPYIPYYVQRTLDPRIQPWHEWKG